MVQGAREHNLNDIDIEIPLGNFVAVTGVSGSGKSTMVRDILLPVLMQRIYKSKMPAGKHRRITGIEHLDKVIDMDQSPIGRTPRSNPATYTGVFDSIRKLFASTNEAKVRGYMPGRFSFNVKGGRCEACAGDGTIKIEMHFLPDVYVPCEVCKGARYNRDTLDIEFKGKNIADVLDMPVAEAVGFFANQPSISRYMETLMDVGLGYVRLGQPAPTLSGGEAQRVKLATELAKRSTGHTIYLLDEPTTGLHFDDVRRLLTVLSRLVDQGNTVLVIEHNLDVIKTADWIIDLGPEGGSGGGTVVAEGTPEHVARRREQPHRPLPPRAAQRLIHPSVSARPSASGGASPQQPLGCDYRLRIRLLRSLRRRFSSLVRPSIPSSEILSSNASSSAWSPSTAPVRGLGQRAAAGRAGRRRRPRSADHLATTAAGRLARRRRVRPPPPPEPGSGILGIQGRLVARPKLRAARAAVAMLMASSRISSSWRFPRYCSTWIPTITAPMAQAGMPKKKRANGYSAMKIRNTASSTGLSPNRTMSSRTAASPGITVTSSSSTAKRARPSVPSISRPKYQKMARVMTSQMPGSLASGQVTTRQI